MNMTNIKNSKGFTLIELMIVVAIIGILAIVAIPQYQNYTQKARFTEVVNSTSATKTAVEICVQSGIAIADCDGGSNGIPANVVAAAGVIGRATADGVITATKATDSNITGTGTVVLTPTVSANSIQWARVCTPVELC